MDSSLAVFYHKMSCGDAQLRDLYRRNGLGSSSRDAIINMFHYHMNAARRRAMEEAELARATAVDPAEVYIQYVIERGAASTSDSEDDTKSQSDTDEDDE